MNHRNTNRHNQQLDTKGHVITETERIEAALQKLGTPTYPGNTQVCVFDIKVLAKWVMQYSKDDWYAGVKQGIALGRKEAVVMLETLEGQAEIMSTKAETDGHNVWGNEIMQAVPLSAVEGCLKAMKEEK